MKKIVYTLMLQFVLLQVYGQSIVGSSINPFQGSTTNLIFTGGGINASSQTSNYYISHGNTFRLNSAGTCASAIPTLILTNGYELSTPLAGTSYEWYLNEKIIPGATSQNLKASESGRYAVKVNISTACTSALSENIFVSILSTLYLENLVSVGPNPFSDFFTIQFSKEFGDTVNLEVFDLQGRTILSEKGVENLEQVDFRTYPKGSYLMNIKGKYQEKIVKLLKF
jgi:hypothetical protein